MIDWQRFSPSRSILATLDYFGSRWATAAVLVCAALAFATLPVSVFVMIWLLAEDAAGQA